MRNKSTKLLSVNSFLLATCKYDVYFSEIKCAPPTIDETNPASLSYNQTSVDSLATASCHAGYVFSDGTAEMTLACEKCVVGNVMAAEWNTTIGICIGNTISIPINKLWTKFYELASYCKSKIIFVGFFS